MGYCIGLGVMDERAPDRGSTDMADRERALEEIEMVERVPDKGAMDNTSL